MISTAISFIVPAHNEARLLPATLRAIGDAAVACAIEYEVIVVDDDSTDRTAQIAAESGARVIAVQHRQISGTRNSGARVASGDMLVFVDADTLINEGVLRKAIDAIARGAIGGGATVRFDGVIPFYARPLIPCLTALMRWTGLAAGCFIFCRRSAFEAVQGFDERLFAAEELAFSAAMKKAGPFVVLRESVLSSGRKLRTYTVLEVLEMTTRLALGGRKMLERRDHLGLWYGPRRDDHPLDRNRSSSTVS